LSPDILELHFRFRIDAWIDLFVCEDNLNSTDFFSDLKRRKLSKCGIGKSGNVG